METSKKARDQLARLETNPGVRCFEIPKVLFDAKSYHEAIDWSVWQNDDHDFTIYPYPPMLRYLKHEEVQQWANKATPEKFEMLPIPCHSQAVERHIKMVSDASIKSASAATRDNIIRATRSSQKKMPVFKSKKYFCA